MTAAAAQPGATPLWLSLVSLAFTLVAGGGGVTALVLVTRQGRKIEAETGKARADSAQVLTSAAVTLLQPLEERLAAAEEENARFRVRLRRVESQLDALIRAIMDPAATITGLREIVLAQQARGNRHDRS